jgi:hypothetical protein
VQLHVGYRGIADSSEAVRPADLWVHGLIEFQAKIIEANNSAFAAQDERAALLQKISELETEVTALKAERRKLDRYQLKDYGDGSFAYELKASEADGEPIHRACAACYQQGNISILQFSQDQRGKIGTTAINAKAACILALTSRAIPTDRDTATSNGPWNLDRALLRIRNTVLGEPINDQLQQ